MEPVTILRNGHEVAIEVEYATLMWTITAGTEFRLRSCHYYTVLTATRCLFGIGPNMTHYLIELKKPATYRELKTILIASDTFYWRTIKPFIPGTHHVPNLITGLIDTIQEYNGAIFFHPGLKTIVCDIVRELNEEDDALVVDTAYSTLLDFKARSEREPDKDTSILLKRMEIMIRLLARRHHKYLVITNNWVRESEKENKRLGLHDELSSIDE